MIRVSSLFRSSLSPPAVQCLLTFCSFVTAAGRLTNGSFNISQHTADGEILKLKFCTIIDGLQRMNAAEPGHQFNQNTFMTKKALLYFVLNTKK